jgi:hypothetical protein
MNIEELRIGNFIQTTSGLFPDNPTKHAWQITAEDLVQIITSDKPEIYEPILLTEEWLNKFKTGNMGEIKKDWTIWENRIRDGSGRFDGYGISFRGSAYPLCLIRYVHQLQNLYYEITGNKMYYEDIK